MSAKRLSRLQKIIIQSLKMARGKLDYEDLREIVMLAFKTSWEKEDSFKASFSRSLKGLEQKGFISRSQHGWYFDRKSLLWEDVKLTKRGLEFITHYKH